MKLSRLFRNNRQILSFEVFPPKPEVPLETLFESIPGFKALSPDYISVTYGAGRSTREERWKCIDAENTYGIRAWPPLCRARRGTDR